MLGIVTTRTYYYPAGTIREFPKSPNPNSSNRIEGPDQSVALFTQMGTETLQGQLLLIHYPAALSLWLWTHSPGDRRPFWVSTHALPRSFIRTGPGFYCTFCLHIKYPASLLLSPSLSLLFPPIRHRPPFPTMRNRSNLHAYA